MSNESNATTTGQAPATPATPTGQAPTGSETNQTTPTQPTQQAQAQQAPDDWKPPTREEWDAYQREMRKKDSELSESRRDAAKYRQEKKEQEDAKLTDLERTAKERDEYKAIADRRAERIIASEVRLHAQALGFNDPADAFSFLDRGKLDLDEDGLPTNAEKLLRDLAERKPYLLKQGPAPTTPPQPRAGAPMNPGRQATSGVIVITAAQNNDFTFRQQFKTQHGMDLLTAQMRGLVQIANG